MQENELVNRLVGGGTGPHMARLKRRSLTEWVNHNCVDGENLKVIQLKNGSVSLMNERTGCCYFPEVEPK